MKNYKYWLYGFAAVAMLTACDVNDDFNLEGSRDVEEKPKVAPVMTLAASDYKAIADNATNQKIAAARGDAEVAALNAIATNKYFIDEAQAETYLPAYIAKQYPTFTEDAKVKVVCSFMRGTSEYMSDFTNISSYTLDSEAYETVWGDKVKASYLSPSTLGKIPSLLKDGIANPQEGNLVAVSYAYSDVEPSIGGGSGEEIPEVSYTPIADAIATGAGEYTVKGEVIALHAKGMLINDGTASILVYLNAMPNYSVGDVIEVIGSAAKNYGFYQFDNKALIRVLERKATFAYPTEAKVVNTAEGLDALATSTIQYVKLTGKLAFTSGKYYNIILDGATHQGSAQYPVAGLVDTSLDGQEVDVTGYVVGYSKSYVNIMANSVTKAGVADEYTPVGSIARSEAGNYKAKGVVAATYAKGFLLADGSGYILVYKSSDVTIGDVVTVSGTTSSYGGLMQFGNSAEVNKVAEGSFSQPTPFELTAAEVDAYAEAPYCAYVSYQGKLSISNGKYFNVTVDGATVVGSISYPSNTEELNALDGKQVTVTGYAIGSTGSSTKYLNVMATNVEETTTKAAATRAASEVEVNKTVLFTYSKDGWVEYSNSDILVSVWQPSDYSDLGMSYIQKPNTVLPTYLSSLYPYVVGGEIAVVVYNAGNAYAAAEYQYKNGVWSTVGEKTSKTISFAKKSDKWTLQSNEYYSNELKGDEGGFTISIVKMDDALSYIWQNDATYGWKASGYKSGNKDTEAWVVSPEIDLSEAEAPYLTYDEAVNYLNGNDLNAYCSVAVTTEYDGSDATASTWENLDIPKRPAGTDWSYVNVGQIDLSAYAGKKVYIGFHYISDSSVATTWEFKNMLVTE